VLRGPGVTFCDRLQRRRDCGAFRGRRVGLSSLIRDSSAITEAVRLDAVAGDSGGRSLSALENAIVATVIAGRSFEILAADRAFCGLLGYGIADLRAMSVSDIVDPDDWQRHRGALNGLMSGVESEVRLAMRCLHKDGRTLRLDAGFAAMIDAAGGIVCAVGRFSDISETSALPGRPLKAGDADEIGAVNELAKTLVHELSQPLAAITNTAHLCTRQIESGRLRRDELLDSMNVITVQGRLASEIIHNARMEMVGRRYARDPFDINELVREAIASFSGSARGKNILIGSEFDTSLPIAQGNRAEIHQVISNLIRNGMEALAAIDDRAAKILVSTRRDHGGGIEVSVADTGPGVAPEAAESIFDGGVTTKPGGFGIGLAICRRIVERHGGRIWLDGGHTSGARIRFTIPVFHEPDAF